MSNETPATAPTKSFLLSKTFWLNLVALASLIAPQVREWLASNPVEFMAVLGAVNIILRFVTKGAVSFSASGISNGENSGRSGGSLPLVLLLVAGSALLALPSCSGTGYPLTGSISYRDPGSGAKGGLVFEEGKAPRASVRIPVYDEDGNLIGVGELSGPLARDVHATK
jgi:hypothetical protein